MKDEDKLELEDWREAFKGICPSVFGLSEHSHTACKDENCPRCWHTAMYWFRKHMYGKGAK